MDSRTKDTIFISDERMLLHANLWDAGFPEVEIDFSFL